MYECQLVGLRILAYAFEIILEDEAPTLSCVVLVVGMSFSSQTVEGAMDTHHQDNNSILRIRFVPGRYAVARLPAGSDIPTWLNGPGF